MKSTLNPTCPEIAPEIATAAEQLGVRAELPQVIAMTQDVFPGNSWRVEIDDDPEIPDDRHLAIVVRTSFRSVDELVASQWKWHERLFACCPAPLAPTFRLSTESRP